MTSYSGALIQNSAREDLALQSGLQDNDKDLRREADRIREERKRSGFGELVGGLQCIIINTEPELQLAVVNELIRYSGLKLSEAFQDEGHRTYVLKVPGEHPFRSAIFLSAPGGRAAIPSRRSMTPLGPAACPTLVWRHLSSRPLTLKSTYPCKARKISNSRET